MVSTTGRLTWVKFYRIMKIFDSFLAIVRSNILADCVATQTVLVSS